MANPARVPDPRNTDPLNPIPPAGTDPFTPDARNPVNDPRVINRVETRSGGSSVLIAAIVLVLAVIAYFVFAPGSDNAPVAPGEPATTTATEPAPAPDATAPGRDLQPRLRTPRLLQHRPIRQRRRLTPLRLLRPNLPRLRLSPPRRSREREILPEMACLGGPFSVVTNTPSHNRHAVPLA